MAEKEVLIKVEGVSKKFCKDLKLSLWYGIKDLITNLKGNKEKRLLRKDEFWAVKDINFELRRGECLGLIGHNGAGKSTLLKILNGLIKPDEGRVTIKGRVGALIELAAGFNPILSGRENIYNNGAILGLTRNEINKKLDKIIEFAELREFIDMPVQNYSSGMKVRLGFAVAAQMEPDVLIVDEVLAVGDLGFILKCLKTIDNIIPNTALIFVSHNMPMVSRICNQIILLNKGKSQFQGNNVSTGIDLYYNSFAGKSSNLIFSDNSFELHKIELKNFIKLENNIPQLKWGDDLELYFKFGVTRHFDNIPLINIIISDKEQRPVAIFEPNNDLDTLIVSDEGILEFVLSSSEIRLSKGIYNIDIVILSRETKGPHFRMNSSLNFQIVHDEDVWQPFLLKSEFQCLSKRILN